MNEIDIRVPDGRTLHAYDTGVSGARNRGTVVFWHHGTPNIGAPPEPLFADADRLGIRWVGYDRPGYGGSSPHPGRDAATSAGDAAAVADALGIQRFAVMSHSGGGPHALACAALLSDRVAAAVVVAGPAPYGAQGLDWFAGMAPAGVASLMAAVQGRAAKHAYEATAAEDDPGFTPEDIAALRGEWSWFMKVVGPAVAAGPGGLIDDDLATVGPWGFDLARVWAPTVILHGGRDRVVPCAHGEWLARHCPTASLWPRPDDGHLSVLSAAPGALEWLCDTATEIG